MSASSQDRMLSAVKPMTLPAATPIYAVGGVDGKQRVACHGEHGPDSVKIGHFGRGSGIQARETLAHLLVEHDLHGPAPQHVGWPDHQRVAYFPGDLLGLFQVPGHA